MARITKKHCQLAVLILLLSTLTACTKAPLEPEPPRPEPQNNRIILAGSTGPIPTLTHLSGIQTLWLPTDEVGLFTWFSDGYYGPHLYTPVPGSLLEPRVYFQGESQWRDFNRLHVLCAYYPYDRSRENDILKPTEYPVKLPARQTQQGNTSDHIGPLDFMFAHPVVVTSPASADAPNPAIEMQFAHLFALAEFQITASPEFEEDIYFVSAQLNAADGVPISLEDGTVDLTIEDPNDPDYGKVNIVDAGALSSTIEMEVNAAQESELLIPKDGNNFSLWAMVLPGDHSPPPGAADHYKPLSITVQILNSLGEQKAYTISHDGVPIRRGVKTILDVDLSPAIADWDGTATEPLDRDPVTASDSIPFDLEAPYHIYSPGELYWLSLNEELISGADIVLHNTIHLSDSLWSPIGEDNPFTGRVFGLGNSITGLKVETDGQYAGLFGQIGDGFYMQDLNVSGQVISSHVDGYVGGIAGGLAAGGYGTQELYNVAFSGSVIGTGTQSIVGGLVGSAQSSDITLVDCDFYNGDVSGYIAGGLIGRNNTGTLTGQSFNHGHITGTYIAGGIIGEQLAAGTIRGGNNYGVVHHTGGQTDGAAGGIVGIAQVMLNFRNCTNTETGTVTGYSAGGLVGRVGGNPWGSSTIDSCYNYGTISADMSGGYAGGLAGAASHVLTDCGNYGNAEGFLAGGLMGGSVLVEATNMTRCYNRGTITSRSTNITGSGAGGLSGRSNTNFTDCYNLGRIDAYYSGGLIAEMRTYWQNMITRCYNAGQIISRTGGANGQIYSRAADTNGNPVTNNPANLSGGTYGLSGSVDLQGLTAFSAAAWPAWPTTTWNLGSWNGGSPIYPTLLSEPAQQP